MLIHNIFRAFRIFKSLLRTKNYIVITDTINDGYVRPEVAEYFYDEITPIAEHLRQLNREKIIRDAREEKKRDD